MTLTKKRIKDDMLIPRVVCTVTRELGIRKHLLQGDFFFFNKNLLTFCYYVEPKIKKFI